MLSDKIYGTASLGRRQCQHGQQVNLVSMRGAAVELLDTVKQREELTLSDTMTEETTQTKEPFLT